MAQPYETVMLHGDVVTRTDLDFSIGGRRHAVHSDPTHQLPAPTISLWSGRKYDGQMWVVITLPVDKELASSTSVECGVEASSGSTLACVLDSTGQCPYDSWQSPVESHGTGEGTWDIHSIDSSGVNHESVVVVVKRDDATDGQQQLRVRGGEVEDSVARN